MAQFKDEEHEQTVQNPNGTLARREFIKAAASAGLIGAGIVACGDPRRGSGDGEEGIDLIREENGKPGTTDWLLTDTSTVPGVVNGILTSGRSPAIEGYCSANSVRSGDNLKVMVSTNPVSRFKLEIFRMGYYNGDGGRLMQTFESVEGMTQLDPDVGENYLQECDWEPSVEFEIPEDWLSGVYLGKMTAEESGLQSYVIFVVRDDRPCDLLVQCSDLTWSAYNRWPVDFAVYSEHTDQWSNTGVPSGMVSFDRPYALFTHPVNELVNSGGSGEFLPWEFPLVFWLEKHGYDVSYISCIDTHSDGEGLLRAKGYISVGHDEYWTNDMYDNVLNARDQGVSLAFLNGNSMFGVVPLLPSTDGTPHRSIRREGWFYDSAIAAQLGERIPINEENFEPDISRDAALLMGVRTPILSEAIGSGDWTCVAPDHWLFEGTGMQAGESIEGLVGWEFHGEPAMSLPGMQVVATGDTERDIGTSGTYTATIYDGPLGNIVFNASTIWWANGLSSPPGHIHPSRHGSTQQGPDERVQQITHNLLVRMIS